MNELPIWPPLAILTFGLLGYCVIWYMGRKLDREEEEAARRKQHPAE